LRLVIISRPTLGFWTIFFGAVGFFMAVFLGDSY
jgi:hypothetical protein